jgi:hypothetical protein
MHLKVFVKPSRLAKKPQKTKKNKKSHWAGFFKKNRVFSNPDPDTIINSSLTHKFTTNHRYRTVQVKKKVFANVVGEQRQAI